MGMCIKLAEEKVEEYKTLHRYCPTEIRDLLKRVHIHNYSIFLKEPENLLFSYWEYTGDNFDKDMEIMAQDEHNQAWWRLCGPCQIPFETRKEGEWWASMEPIFFN